MDENTIEKFSLDNIKNFNFNYYKSNVSNFKNKNEAWNHWNKIKKKEYSNKSLFDFVSYSNIFPILSKFNINSKNKLWDYFNERNKLNKFLKLIKSNFQTARAGIYQRKNIYFNKYIKIYENYTPIRSNFYNNINLVKCTYNKIKNVGIVVTTHGNNGIYIKQTLYSLFKFCPSNTFIILFINESEDPITLNIKDYFKNNNLEVIYIKNQMLNGGLTATWNQGIDICFERNCEIIILSNDDIFVDNSIKFILEEVNKCNDTLQYFGPVTNNPGPNNKCQYAIDSKNIPSKILEMNNKIWNLNGFFLVFPKHVLLANKFNNSKYFDPKFKFAGNEVEWHNRFLEKGGVPILVSKTFVYHYKLSIWKKKLDNKFCMYLINLGGYEKSLYLDGSKFNFPIFYFSDNLNFIKICIKNNIIPMLVFNCDKQNPRLEQRKRKILFNDYLPNYNYNIYIDGNVIPLFNNLNDFDLKNYELICFNHPSIKKRNINDELVNILNLNLIKQNDVIELKKKFHDNSFKDDVGLSETSILIRKNNKKIHDFNKLWFEFINICIRDQASFDYVKWKSNINYNQIPIKDRPIFKVKHSE